MVSCSVRHIWYDWLLEKEQQRGHQHLHEKLRCSTGSAQKMVYGHKLLRLHNSHDSIITNCKRDIKSVSQSKFGVNLSHSCYIHIKINKCCHILFLPTDLHIENCRLRGSYSFRQRVTDRASVFDMLGVRTCWDGDPWGSVNVVGHLLAVRHLTFAVSLHTFGYSTFYDTFTLDRNTSQ